MAETKVFPWSYRATLMEAYRHSPLIINTAIRNAISGNYLPKLSDGRNCHLPSNLAVAGFVSRTVSQSVRRLLYGAFKEKEWRVSTVPFSRDKFEESLLGGELPPAKEWRTLSVASDYSFYADPFFASDPPAILVEALRARSARRNRQDRRGWTSRAHKREGHIAYPATAAIDGREVIVPETASWSEPRAYVFDGSGARLLTTLRIEGRTHVEDPTLIERNGRIDLLGNDRKVGSNSLQVWLSNSLERNSPWILRAQSGSRRRVHPWAATSSSTKVGCSA